MYALAVWPCDGNGMQNSVRGRAQIKLSRENIVRVKHKNYLQHKNSNKQFWKIDLSATTKTRKISLGSADRTIYVQN